MNSSLIFPIIIGLMNSGASAVYLFHGDWKRSLYWAACVLITLAVTA